MRHFRIGSFITKAMINAVEKLNTTTTDRVNYHDNGDGDDDDDDNGEGEAG